jgi:hypothetical protein
MSGREQVDERRIVITDVDIPFGRLIVILIKIALASIPAMIVAWAIVMAILMLFALVFGAPFHWRMMQGITGGV